LVYNPDICLVIREKLSMNDLHILKKRSTARQELWIRNKIQGMD